MEDNYTSKKSVDQAWGVMKDILDKEMPVKEERRFPFIPLFLGTALLLCLSFGVYSYFSSTSVPKPEENFAQDKASKKIAVYNSEEYNTKNIKSVNTTKANQEKESTAQTNILSNAHEKLISSLTNVSSAKRNIVDQSKLRNIGTKQRVRKEPEDKTKVESFVDIENQTEAERSISYHQRLSYDSSEKLNDIKIQNKDTRKYAKLEFVATPKLVNSPSFAHPIILEEGINTKVHHSLHSNNSRNVKLDWAINLYAAQRLWIRKSENAFGPKLKDLGNLAGLEILFSTMHKNWRIGSGLGYKFSGPTFGNRPSSSIGVSNSISSRDEFSEFILEDSASVGIDVEFRGPQTHFVSIPLFLERRLCRKWSVEAGLRYNQKVGNFRSIVFKEFRKSNVDFFLTPSFEISKRWSLGLMLQHSTNQFNLFNTLQIKERGRTQLGLVSRIRI